MAFCLDTRDLPVIGTYEKAAVVEARIKPIRGRSDNCKPLSKNRSKQHLTIRKDNDNIIIKLHQTDVLTYYPDGLIEVRMGGWDSLSTRMLVGDVLGVGVTRHKNITYITTSQGRLPVQTGYAKVNQYRWVETEQDGYTKRELVCLNPTYPEKTKMKRREAREEYKKYDEFKRVLMGLGKIYRDAPMSEVSAAYDAAGGRSCGWLQPKDIVEKALVPETMAHAALALLWKHGERGTWTAGVGWDYSVGFEPKDAKRIWTKFQKAVVEANADRLTYKVSVTDGTMV